MDRAEAVNAIIRMADGSLVPDLLAVAAYEASKPDPEKRLRRVKEEIARRGDHEPDRRGGPRNRR